MKLPVHKRQGMDGHSDCCARTDATAVGDKEGQAGEFFPRLCSLYMPAVIFHLFSLGSDPLCWNKFSPSLAGTSEGFLGPIDAEGCCHGISGRRPKRAIRDCG